MNVSKKTKVADLINYRIKVTTLDSRQLAGQLLSFDKHMNLVLADCEEYRLTKKSLQELKEASRGAAAPATAVEQKRMLGLVILRGEQVVSLVIESPPPTEMKTRITGLAGSGTIKQLGIPTPQAPVGSQGASLGGPVPTGARSFVPPPGFKR